MKRESIKTIATKNNELHKRIFITIDEYDGVKDASMIILLDYGKKIDVKTWDNEKSTIIDSYVVINNVKHHALIRGYGDWYYDKNNELFGIPAFIYIYDKELTNLMYAITDDYYENTTASGGGNNNSDVSSDVSPLNMDEETIYKTIQKIIADNHKGSTVTYISLSEMKDKPNIKIITLDFDTDSKNHEYVILPDGTYQNKNLYLKDIYASVDSIINKYLK